MRKVIFSLVFNRKKLLNAEGKALVQVEAYQNGQKRYFSTHVYIQPSQWDHKRQSIKNHPNMDGLNRFLKGFIHELEKTELNLHLSGKNFSLKDISVNSTNHPSLSFTSFMKKEITDASLKESTLKNHLSTWQILSVYKKDISFQEFDFKLLCDFESFLLKQQYHKNTVAKHMKHLKRYLNLAINKDLYEVQNSPFRKYKIRYQESKRTHLTPDELLKLENLAFDKRKTLKKCLDIFLFSCYTGLRFSDIVSLTNDNFHTIEGNPWLIYSSVKTDIHIRIPLSLLFQGKAIPIYNQYNKNKPTLFNISQSANSNINKQLQKIAQFAGLKKRISFHCLRHNVFSYELEMN